MCFLNTGVGNEEFEYEETDTIPNCMNCRFRYNLSVVAPCFDCNGYYDTGRSYFTEKQNIFNEWTKDKEGEN